ncbi:FG-GAP repeat domain-containing protein [Pseudooceanicola onchidii]|uniref:FG-GAP repeat domain-containing protein n=1 Tax=Pseudooceanicola onchidii TaxID=2562279 RepID=UPI001F0F2C6E|nr:VCBS repeat-containing protein [Pseudooceanicola onchidii]
MARARPRLSRPCLPGVGRALGGLALWLALTVPAAAGITAATYEGPTDRYDHGVLGDKLEWTTLALTLDDGTIRRFTLPEDMVFEDLTPRLADVTGDGAAEVITVESSLSKGARLTVYGAEGRLISTAFIGQRNRWLAPVGAADFDGDGTIEIAYVDRPHLIQTLRLIRIEAGEFVEIASLRGVTNHRLGWDYIPGGVRTCTGRPEMILATGDWLANLSVFWLEKEQRLDTRAEGRFTGPASMERLLRCEG